MERIDKLKAGGHFESNGCLNRLNGSIFKCQMAMSGSDTGISLTDTDLRNP